MRILRFLNWLFVKNFEKSKFLKNQNFPIFMKKRYFSRKFFFKKTIHIFCNFITRGKKLIKNFCPENLMRAKN